MAKTKQAKRPTPPRRLIDRLSEAQTLINNNEPEGALEILLELERSYPDSPELLSTLGTAYYDLNDTRGYERAIRRLVKVSPRSADYTLALAGALMSNMRPALALRAFEDFLNHWPEHPKAKEARESLALLQKGVDELIEQSGQPREAALDEMELNEDLSFYLESGDFQRGRNFGEKLLKRHPDFTAGANNLSQIYARLGLVQQAIDLTRQVLEKEPGNLHARANQARMLFLSGRMEEAQAEVERLKADNAESPDRWAKLAEVFSMLGDDPAVLALHDRASRSKEPQSPGADMVFYHLLAVSALRQGKEKEARRFWKKSLEIEPNFTLARENLADLDAAPENQNGPWAFPFENWFLGPTISDLIERMIRQEDAKDKERVRAEIREYLSKHPEITFLAPHLLDRGEPLAREFVLRLAAISAAPEIVEPARAFIFGRQGSYKLRADASQWLAQAGLLPPGPVRLWAGDEQRESLQLDIEITTTPASPALSKAAQDLTAQAFQAMDAGDGKRAQELLERALTMHPDQPSLLMNLASALEIKGEVKKAHELIRDIHRRFPDYFFGIVGAARLDTLEGNLKLAHELLNGLLERKKMHISEYTQLCIAQMEVWLAEKDNDAARRWLELLERFVPDHPRLPEYRQRISGTGGVLNNLIHPR